MRVDIMCHYMLPLTQHEDAASRGQPQAGRMFRCNVEFLGRGLQFRILEFRVPKALGSHLAPPEDRALQVFPTFKDARPKHKNRACIGVGWGASSELLRKGRQIL